MMEGYMCTNEAIEYLGLHQLAFYKFVAAFGLKSVRKSRYTYYRKEDIEKLNERLGNRVPTLIRMLEKLTGCTVILREMK